MAIITRQKKRIGDLLVDAGVITQEKLETALELQKERKQKLGIVLIEEGYVTEQQIAYTLHKQMGYDIVELGKYNISTDILKLVPDVALLKRANAIPFEFDPFDSQYLRVAMSDPLDIFAIDDIQMVTGMQVSPVIATQSDIMSAIDKYYGSAENQAVADMFNQGRELEEEEEEAVDESIENAPIVILVRRIIEQGVHKRASDIHIEPMETKIRVRYRVDGVMQEAGAYQVSMLAAIITRIKIVGGMDISEKRKPQDGRITAMVDRNEYDIRVSILPTVYGEKVVMRLTSKQTLSRDKKLLGFSDDELKRFDRMFANPNGIILVTGPTGSGKSTTLASMIDIINTNYSYNIITLEDPVEYLHRHKKSIVNQREVGLDTKSYTGALRAALREDPDVILIGEMRDLDTIQTAITAAETGHLVFSTLHTIGAPATIDRIIDVFPPYQQSQIRSQLALVLEGVISQQLIPSIGGKGRVAAFEVMLATPAIRNLIREAKTHQLPSIMQTNKRSGMQTMDDALYDLYMKRLIDRDRCLSYAQDPQALSNKLY